MTSEDTNKPHQKHAKLNRPIGGTFGRNELSIVGTTCDNIKALAHRIINQLPTVKVAYIDADHKKGETKDSDNAGFLEYVDKISFQRFDFKTGISPFQKKTFFNECDLAIVNGNHFAGQAQIVVIDPGKNLEKKLPELTNVQLILVKEQFSPIPDFLLEKVDLKKIPVLSQSDEIGITKFLKGFISERVPALHGLILSGGLSSRMKRDKGALNYHGKSQREYLFNLLSNFCSGTFVSCNAKQVFEIPAGMPLIGDTFLNLGPMGGILSALQSNPNVAWLSIACDLPYLSEKTISYLIKNRNPSKIATAFLDPKGEFPEPLVTIWEPKSYLVLLQFLSQGYSCPRKVLINSDIKLLQAPDEKEFLNVNFHEEYEIALKDFRTIEIQRNS